MASEVSDMDPGYKGFCWGIPGLEEPSCKQIPIHKALNS